MLIKKKYIYLPLILLISACGDGTNGATGIGASSTGQGGSMARFTIVEDILYAISGSHIQLIDVSNPQEPAIWNRISVNFGIETLFSYNNYLFVGSETGVYIYENSIPEFPQYLSEFTHVRSCDPVVVEGNYAYVTLRSNSRCWGSVNQLDILDISDIYSPVLEKTYNMYEPFGLGISENKLFVCDGRAGLKVFNVENKSNIQSIETLSAVECYDVIPYNNNLIVSAKDGLYQFSYNNEFMEELSYIPSVKQILTN